MVAAVNTQTPASPLTGGASVDRTEQPLKELDSGDQQAAVVNISAEGAKRAGTATQATQAAPSVQDQPARLDDGSAVQVTAPQLQTSAPKAPPADASGGGAGGAAPAGGETTAVSTSASTSQTYEPADTDEDGTVSPMERQAYEAKLADEKAAAQAEKSARAAEADAAVRAYEAVEQLGGAAAG
ncbi:hypothetical protein ASC95_09680 [Pelomonas sp. Root1217]|uniref:hypothetical protein n=1 Tax=Pelomonas sp. Root1217 TaxID=1736430 RepID=UPI000708A653|nr:hypothetical protein [Pelomonas sp. Root1217]KQV53031.1 hypothetical protein ASC95_09680 [Pelomonas sp. Root1217]